MKDFAQDPITLGIVGAGIMGRGIAQVAAMAGIRVILNDANETATNDAVGFINKMLDRAVEKGRMSEVDAETSKGNISISSNLTDLADADLIIEAIIEKLEIKQPLFKELEGIVSGECILATNTSSLSVTAVATACEKQHRVAGCHFFNPVPLMKLVEVIGGVRTGQTVVEQLTAFVKRIGHTPVSVNDSPGFLVNHFGRGLNTEGLRILSEAVSEPFMIDAVVRDCIGLRMGPFELMDLTALDVTCPVTEQIYEQFYHDPRLRPTPTLRQRYVAGILGRKAGEGFYAYEDGNKQVPEEPPAPALDDSVTFWIDPDEAELADKVSTILKAAGVKIDEGEEPQQDSVCIVTPLGIDTSTATLEAGLNPARTVAADVLLNTDKRITLMTNPATDKQFIDHAWAAFAKAGLAVSVIRDSAGFISQRLIANIVNTACEIAQQGIAAPEDIDTAARLGLGYPKGPLTMGDEIGPVVILEILENIQALYGDPRYRPSPWLTRRAQLGLSLLHPENV